MQINFIDKEHLKKVPFIYSYRSIFSAVISNLPPKTPFLYSIVALLNKYSISGSTTKSISFTENSLSSSLSSSGTIPNIGPFHVNPLTKSRNAGLSFSFKVSLKIFNTISSIFKINLIPPTLIFCG